MEYDNVGSCDEGRFHFDFGTFPGSFAYLDILKWFLVVLHS